jgi:lysyl-tRNA synthetase class 2
MEHSLSEQEILRREALDQLIKLNINPYPQETFEVNTTTTEIINNFPNNRATISRYIHVPEE